jgi:hypothetical protein
MYSTLTSTTEPPGQFKTNKAVPEFNCQKFANESMGGLVIRWAGLEIFIDVSETSKLVLLPLLETHSTLQVALVVLVDVGAQTSTRFNFIERLMNANVVFVTVQIPPNAPCRLLGVIETFVTADAATKRNLWNLTTLVLIWGIIILVFFEADFRADLPRFLKPFAFWLVLLEFIVLLPYANMLSK